MDFDPTFWRFYYEAPSPPSSSSGALDTFLVLAALPSETVGFGDTDYKVLPGELLHPFERANFFCFAGQLLGGSPTFISNKFYPFPPIQPRKEKKPCF